MYCQINKIISYIKTKYNVSVSELDIWFLQRSGSIASKVIDKKVMFDMDDALKMYSIPRKNVHINKYVKERVQSRFQKLWGHPMSGSYSEDRDDMITEDALLEYNTALIKEIPLLRK